MAIRKIARMGHPILRQPARDLTQAEIGSDELKRLIGDMIETMSEYEGVGLAAPQVHESIRLALIEIDPENPRYSGQQVQPLLVLINPKVTVLDPVEQGFWEGCLSIPEIRGLVYRPRKIQVDYLDVHGESQTIVGEDFMATVLQHELDHLDGVLFMDRIRMVAGKSPIAFLDEFRRYGLPTPDTNVGELED